MTQLESASRLRTLGRSLLGARVGVLVSLLTLAFFAPVALGLESLFFRDLANFHWPAKLEQARAWRALELPFLDLWRAGGQPGMGNPNTLPLYPSNVLLLAPGPGGTLWGFNVHLWGHFLLAPLAFAWLARSLGLGFRAAWVGAVLYATSGFAFSLLAFYNLIAMLPLLPALLAASLNLVRSGPMASTSKVTAADSVQAPGTEKIEGDEGASEGTGAGFANGAEVAVAIRLTVLAVLWSLVLLAGDPITAVLAMAATCLLLLIYRRSWSSRGLFLGMTAFGIGTLIAWPQVAELLRTLEGSVRSTLGFSAAGILRGSFHPAMLLDQVVPFALGAPTPDYWGQRFHGGAEPLFYSLFPGALGLLTVCLALISWRSMERRAFWLGSVLFVGGLFFALGAFNPVVALLTQSSEATFLRFPVKFWWWIALGMGLVGACGFENLEAASEGRSSVISRIQWVALGLGSVYLILFLLAATGLLSPVYEALIAEVFPPGAKEVGSAVAAQISRVLVASALGTLLCFLVAWMGKTGALGERAWVALLLLHVATQLILLRPLYPTIPAGELLATPEVVAGLDGESMVVHGSVGGGVGGAVDSRTPSPDGDSNLEGSGATSPRTIQDVQRRALRSGYPASGVVAGVRYQFNSSPEGLDSYLPGLMSQILRSVPDTAKVRLLEASGATHLIAQRPVEDPNLVLEKTDGQRSNASYRYRLPRARELVLAERWVETERPQQAVEAMLEPSFDPRTMVAVAAIEDGSHDDGPDGTAFDNPGSLSLNSSVRKVSETRNRIELQTTSSRPTVLALRRSYLPRYRAFVDGEERPTTLANLVRLAVRVPAGDHNVVVEFDRSGWPSSIMVSAVGWLALLLVVARLRRVRRLRRPSTSLSRGS